jgi:hypothetical protein
VLIGVTASFLPPRPSRVKISVLKRGELQGRFALLMVTTLQRLLLEPTCRGPKAGGSARCSSSSSSAARWALHPRALVAAIRGRLGRYRMPASISSAATRSGSRATIRA